MIIIYSILTALFFALTFFFRKLAGKTLPLQKALVIEVFVELLLFLLLLFFFSPSQKGINLKDKGVIFAILGGICVTLGVASNFLAVRSGLLSKVIAITSPSQIMFGVILAIFLLRESLTITQLFGIILGIISVILLSIK